MGSWITDTAVRNWNKYTPTNWHTTTSLTPPDAAILDPTPYGSAGKRTQTQTHAAQRYGSLILLAIPPTHHIAYTDGSALQGGEGKSSQGPSGSGLHLEMPLRNGSRAFIDSTTALGQGTNNVGELFAIGMAIDAFLQNSAEGQTLHILTDSRYATLLQWSMGGWPVATFFWFALSVPFIGKPKPTGGSAFTGSPPTSASRGTRPRTPSRTMGPS